jgi:hypothetical protein
VTVIAATHLPDARDVSAADAATLRPLGRVKDLGEVVNRILDLEPLLASPGHTRSHSIEERPWSS